jgi:hypothetical protein
MDRRKFSRGIAFYSFLSGGAWPRWLKAETLPAGTPAPKPISEDDFPDRLHLFVWRYWELVNLEPF